MLKRAAAMGLVTILAMGGQFLVRLVLTAMVGPGTDLDAFNLAMGWGGAISAAIFQVVAVVLAPRLAGRPAAGTVRLGRRLAGLLMAACILLTLIAAAVVALIAGVHLGLLALVVLLGWGVANGVFLYQRQLLQARERALGPALLGLLPAIGILGAVACGAGGSLLGLALVGTISWSLAAAVATWQLERSWPERDTHPPAPARPVLRAALPVLGASWNSQAVQRLQDALAAFAQVGGATIFGNALALARLPQTVADAMFSATAYPAALRALAEGDAGALGAAYRVALRVHLAVMVPTAVAVLVAGHAAAEAVYARGACTPADAARIAQVLGWTAPGMVAVSLQCVHAQLLVAAGRGAALLRIELGLSVLSIAGSLAALGPLGLGGIIAGHSAALCLSQIPMLLVLARIGLRWQDTLTELVRALLPALAAAAAAEAVVRWLGDGAGAWPRALAAGVTVLLITGPCSAWAIRNRPKPRR